MPTDTPTIHPELDLIGVVVADMAASLAFYRELGLALPPDADAQPHVEVALPGGVRLAWDTVDTIRSFDPAYEAPSGSPRVALAFKVDTPADVDATYDRLVAAGHHGHKAPWDAFSGQRYAVVHGPRRQRRRPLRRARWRPGLSGRRGRQGASSSPMRICRNRRSAALGAHASARR